MTKKVLDKAFFDEDTGDIIDKIIREDDYLKRSEINVVDDPEIKTALFTVDELIKYYQKKLPENEEALSFLSGKGIEKTAVISNFKTGFSDGSLIKILSKKQIKELTVKGLIDEKGVEIFLNHITLPLLNEDDEITGIAGVNICDSTVKRIFFAEKLVLSGAEAKGVLNLKVVKAYDEIILTNDILTALKLASTGIENVISITTDDDFTGELVIKLKEHRVKTVIIAFNSLNNSLIDLIKNIFITDEIAVKIIFIESFNKDEILELVKNATLYKSETDKFSDLSLNVKKDNGFYLIQIDDLKYKLTGLKEIYSINLRVHIKAEMKDIYHHDTVDLYSAKSRSEYALRLSRKFNIESVIIEKDLDKILEYLEKEKIKAEQTLDHKETELTAEEKETGLKFLNNPDIFKEITEDLTTMGYVGEELNKKLIYLCASSRKLDDPISILIVSQSASGKSMLVDTVKKLIPEDEVVAVTSLSDQALNYIENLTNKFLVFGESVHNEIIEHQIREMLSSKELTRLVTVKDEKSGKMKTELVKKRVIVASVMSTTNHKLNPENATRYFLINADETKVQTRLIHEAQKEKYTLKRQFIKTEVIPEIIKKHKIAQKMLKKIVIVNDFAKYLNFPDSSMRTRRDHDRFIDLIAAVCNLRQYQKEIKKSVDVEYIECDLEDYKTAYDIMVNGILSSTMSEVPKQAVNLYDEIRSMVNITAKEKKLLPEEIRFIQREVREYTHIGADTIRKYIKMLVDFEYLLIASGRNKGLRQTYSLKKDEDIEKLDLKIIPTPEEIMKKL